MVDPSSADQAESIQVDHEVTVAELPAVAEEGVPMVWETPLVVASASAPSTSLSAGTSHFMDDQRLVEEVLKEFDPAHRLVELSSA